MKNVKLLALQITPLVGIFEDGVCIGEAVGDKIKIYPGNNLSDVVRQLKEILEVEIDEPKELVN